MTYTELIDRIAALSETDARAALMLLASDHADAVAEALDRLAADRLS